MKLNEGQRPVGLRQLALAAILSGCVANTEPVQATDGLRGQATITADTESHSQTDHSAYVRCATMSYLRCDGSSCHWQNGYIGFNQSSYSSAFYQNFRNSTVDCSQLRISSPRDLTCNSVNQSACRGDYVPLKLVRQHFSTHPAIQQLWENSAFLSFPEEKGVGGAWIRRPSSVNGAPQSTTSNSEIRYLVNVVPDQFTNGVGAVSSVIHEMGHGIFEVVLSEAEKREFTDLIFEIEDIVDLDEARVARDITRDDLSSFLDANDRNLALADALPNAQMIANAFSLERQQMVQATFQHDRLTRAEVAALLRRSEQDATDISRDNLKLHKLHAMSYFMRIALTLYQMMNVTTYDDLGRSSCRQSNFINIEAYAYMFSFSGCMSDLFAPYFKPYLSDDGWLLRQYSLGADNQVLAHNPYLYTPEGRAEIRQEFRAFWRRIETRSAPAAAH